MPISFTATQWVEVIAAITMPLTVIGYAVQRAARGGAIFSKTIQIVGVFLFLPAVLILGLEKDIPEAALGTLLGAVAGYLLSNIGKEADDAPRI